MSALLQYFENKITISKDLAEKLEVLSVEKTYKKGEIIQEEHSFKKEHIFVVEGCLRSYFLDDNGKEHTIQFAIKNWWIGDYITLYTEHKSVLRIESLSDTKIIVIDRNKVYDIFKNHPEFEVVQRKNFEKHIATLQKRVVGLLSMSASEKYNEFVNDYHDFEKIIPNYQIASYLGITPESLSRIRRKRTEK